MVMEGISGILLALPYYITFAGRGKGRIQFVASGFVCGGLGARDMICDHLVWAVVLSEPQKVDVMWSIGSSPILRPGAEEAFSTGWKGIRCWIIEAVPRLYITTLINN